MHREYPVVLREAIVDTLDARARLEVELEKLTEIFDLAKYDPAIPVRRRFDAAVAAASCGLDATGKASLVEAMPGRRGEAGVVTSTRRLGARRPPPPRAARCSQTAQIGR